VREKSRRIKSLPLYTATLLFSYDTIKKQLWGGPEDLTIIPIFLEPPLLPLYHQQTESLTKQAGERHSAVKNRKSQNPPPTRWEKMLKTLKAFRARSQYYLSIRTGGKQIYFPNYYGLPTYSTVRLIIYHTSRTKNPSLKFWKKSRGSISSGCMYIA